MKKAVLEKKASWKSVMIGVAYLAFSGFFFAAILFSADAQLQKAAPFATAFFGVLGGLMLLCLLLRRKQKLIFDHGGLLIKTMPRHAVRIQWNRVISIETRRFAFAGHQIETVQLHVDIDPAKPFLISKDKVIIVPSDYGMSPEKMCDLISKYKREFNSGEQEMKSA